MSKFWTAIYLLVFSLGAHAQLKLPIVVLQVEDLLAQPVSRAEAQSYQKQERLFSVTKPGSRQKLSFYMRPNAEALIAALAQRHFSLRFASSLGAPMLKAFLEKVPMSGGTAWDKYQNRLLTDKELKKGLWDLKEVEPNLKLVLFLTTQEKAINADQQEQQITFSLPSIKFYETYMEAKRRANASESDWLLSQQVLGRIYLAFSEASNLSEARDRLKDEPLESGRHGSLVMEGRWDKKEPRWQFSADFKTINTCAEFDNNTDKVIRSLPKSECIAISKTDVRYVSDDSNLTSTCQLFEAESGATIENAPAQKCLDAFPKNKKTYWRGNTQNNCAYFTNDLYYVAAAPASKCDDEHLLINPNNHQPTVVPHRDGMEKLTLQQIFASPPPDSKNIFRLWAPYDADSKVGFTLGGCQIPDEGNHAAKDIPRCHPDTLYSWGIQAKLDYLKAAMGNGRWKNTFRTLYASRSAVATDGYGPIPVRFKIRSDAKWKKVPDGPHFTCDNVKDPENTIYYYTWTGGYGVGLDYAICSPQVLASWSYATPEHYDEIVKDFLYLTNPSVPDSKREMYVHGDGDYITTWSVDFDGHDFSKATLKSSLVGMQRMINAKSGDIYYNPNIRSSEKNRESHFSTDHPIWFNEH